MANVNQINDTTQPVTGLAQNKSRLREGSDAFNTLLTHAMGQTTDAQSTQASAELQELASPSLAPPTLSSLVYGKTDDLLGLMDDYVSQLGNTRISLKAIAPMLEQMNADADALMQETRYLGNQDTGLKEIATRAAVAARTEYLRFQRGDYLS